MEPHKSDFQINDASQFLGILDNKHMRKIRGNSVPILN